MCVCDVPSYERNTGVIVFTVDVLRVFTSIDLGFILGEIYYYITSTLSVKRSQVVGELYPKKNK